MLLFLHLFPIRVDRAMKASVWTDRSLDGFAGLETIAQICGVLA